jgi:hypothetical protein
VLPELLEQPVLLVLPVLLEQPVLLVLPEPQPLVLVVCLLVQELHCRQLLHYRHLLLVYLEQLLPLSLLC